MIYLQLFWSFFQIGLFSIGGGYAALPLIQHQVVELHGWLTMTEFTDLITISQMTPGPIAINASTFVGTQIAGFPGALVATVGCVAPSCVIVSVLALLYAKYKKLALMEGILSGLRPAVVALIASAGISILVTTLWEEGPVGLSGIDVASLVLFAAGFIVLRKWKPNPILVMVGCGVAGVIVQYGRSF